MDEETQGPPPLTTEQQQRQDAVLTASSVLRGTTASRTALAGRGEVPGKVTDLVDLANYIYEGEPYSVKAERQHLADHPLHILGSIFGEAVVVGDQPESGYKDQPSTESDDKDPWGEEEPDLD